MLKIPIVLANSVSKSLCQTILIRSSGHCQRGGKNIIFRGHYGYKQRLGPLVPKREDNFPTFPLGLEFLNEAEKEKTRKDSASAPSRFASLFEGEIQQILTERHSGKNKQITNWSGTTFKGKLKFLF